MSRSKKKNASKPYGRVIFALRPTTREAFRVLSPLYQVQLAQALLT